MGCVTTFFVLDKEGGDSQIEDVVRYRYHDKRFGRSESHLRSNQLQQYSYTENG